MGDFNCPDIDWNTLCSGADQCNRLLFNFVTFNGFVQCVTRPTRAANFLDLVFSNDPLIVSSTHNSPPFGTSDHDSVTIDIVFSTKTAVAGNIYRTLFTAVP
jgi:endonuclease/exonuclease/phosphatase family metal-dependent hydrolase